MIEKNLGNIERVCRLVLATLFALWVSGQPVMGMVEWFVVTIALMLMLNGIFSRCYFWFILDLDTRPQPRKATCV